MKQHSSPRYIDMVPMLRKGMLFFRSTCLFTINALRLVVVTYHLESRWMESWKPSARDVAGAKVERMRREV